MFSPYLASAPAATSSLEVYALGVVEYSSLLGLQDRIAYELTGRSDRKGVLLLCEHPPIATIGREGTQSSFSFTEESASVNHVPLQWVGRGGKNLIHLPGQLAVYPLLPLERIGCSPGEFRAKLLETMCLVCREQRVEVTVDSLGCGVVARTGVVGQLGTAISSWVSRFGFYLNVQPDLDFMRGCYSSSDHERLSSLAAERMKHIAMSSVRESAARHLAGQFGYEQHHWYSGHPLLTRTKRRIHVHA